MVKKSSNIDVNIGIGKSSSEEGRPQKVSPAGARREVRGEVNLSPGLRRFGRKEEKKKTRKEEGKLGGEGGR